ncbi:DUF7210 family protein [Niallia sp. 03190]|uniref:DUF7210 family protein n=1 Tax=Niallia sp. 03190 TaxID=3458061 RepID=UPI0040439D9C
MPKYIANAYLVHGEEIIQIGSEVELTKEQADRLGDKVSAKTKAGATNNIVVTEEK